MKRGRKKIALKLKKVQCNFTVSPEVARKLETIKGEKSAFISKALETIPMEWIKMYNETPLDFLNNIFPQEI